MMMIDDFDCLVRVQTGRVGPVKYRGFNQATVTGAHLGPGGAAGFQEILLRVPSQAGSPDAPSAPKCPCQRPVRIEPWRAPDQATPLRRCEPANDQQPATRNPQSAAGPGFFELIRLPADCPHLNHLVARLRQHTPAEKSASALSNPRRRDGQR